MSDECVVLFTVSGTGHAPYSFGAPKTRFEQAQQGRVGVTFENGAGDKIVMLFDEGSALDLAQLLQASFTAP